MAGNLPLRLTYEHARGLADSLAEWIERVKVQLAEQGYELSVIDFEIALLMAQGAAKYGIDLLGRGRGEAIPQPVKKGGNGV